jgi:glycine betaine/choline ABC-type transport system substrate-binding protein
MKKILTIIMAVMLILSMTGCSGNDEVIKITHKDYTEQRITGQLMSLYLQSKGFETEVTELSGTMLCYTALKNGDVDMYPEFTGTAYGAIFKQTEIIGIQETFDYVKKASEDNDGITWLEPLGWNNTYVLTVRKETADELNLATISDLSAVSSDMILGSDDEFVNRSDGLEGLKGVYPGLEFSDVISMDQGLTYAALIDGTIDVNTSYSTDGRIAKFGLINIEDDKQFFPPYFVTPILRVEYAKENPEVVKALEELGGHWTTEDMQVYNLMVDEGESSTDVARLMLTDVGLLEK